jgi:hypothetical protein
VAEDRVAEALSADADESGGADEDVLRLRVGAGGGEGSAVVWAVRVVVS